MTPDTPPNKIPWPPIILVSGIAAGFVLRAIWPLPWTVGAARDVLKGVGVVLVIVAILLILLSIRELRNHKTTVNPTGKSTHLVTSGPFAFSRNPIYLSNMLLISGLGLATSNAWMLLIAAVTGVLEHRFAILREERHLEARFGKAWRDYAKRVRRWV
jgi:protein-S-isoprenylcysteine O-methyltransferase Ste14